MKILLTGGTGYIGSHTAVALRAEGHEVVLFDNLANSQAKVVDSIAQITGKAVSSVPFVQGDIRDTAQLKEVLSTYHIDAMIHFAGLKAVGESVQNPLAYYANNVQGTISSLQAMQACELKPWSLVAAPPFTVSLNTCHSMNRTQLLLPAHTGKPNYTSSICSKIWRCLTPLGAWPACATLTPWVRMKVG